MRKVEIKGIKYAYTDMLGENPGMFNEEAGESPLMWLALCMLAQSGCGYQACQGTEDLEIQEFHVHSQGIHMKVNGKHVFMRAQKVETEEEMMTGNAVVT